MTTLLMPLLLITQILFRSLTASHLVLLNSCKSSSSSSCVGWWVPLPGGVSLSTCPMIFISYVYSFPPLPFVISLNPPEFGEGEINECSADYLVPYTHLHTPGNEVQSSGDPGEAGPRGPCIPWAMAPSRFLNSRLHSCRACG